jgi:transposase
LKRRYVLTFFQKLSPCLVGIEACASSHHWSRELQVSLSRHRPIVLGDAQVVAPNARDRLHALRPRHQGPTTKKRTSTFKDRQCIRLSISREAQNDIGIFYADRAER